MKKKLLTIVVGIMVLFSLGATSYAKDKKDKEDSKVEFQVSNDGAVLETKYVRVEYKECFPAKYSKYDEVLAKTCDINEYFNETDYKLGIFNKKIAFISGTTKEMADDPKAVIEELKQVLKEHGVTIQITIIIGDGKTKYKVKVLEPKKGDLPADVKRIVMNLESALQDLEEMSYQAKVEAKEAADLIPLCNNLVTSAPKDFSGFDARFAPKAASKLKESAAQLTAAADRAKKVGDKIEELSKILKESFKG